VAWIFDLVDVEFGTPVTPSLDNQCWTFYALLFLTDGRTDMQDPQCGF